jgi:prepilin-type N-terminal cleavage/methylation domain-containing protein
MNFIKKHSGFTLVEIMIVISIILFLASLSLFPYIHAMKRAYIERTRDIFAQEWILSHRSIKNGLLSTSGSHTNKVLIFDKNITSVDVYEYTGTGFGFENQENSLFTGTFEKISPLILQNDVKILDIRSDTWSVIETPFLYHIVAPEWRWFFVWKNGEALSFSGIFVTLGYTLSESWASLRELFLRPYLQ